MAHQRRAGRPARAPALPPTAVRRNAATASSSRKRAPSAPRAAADAGQVRDEFPRLREDGRELGGAGAELRQQGVRARPRAGTRAAPAPTASTRALLQLPSSAPRARARRCRRACAASASAKRLLPIPGSPATTTSAAGAPGRASRRAKCGQLGVGPGAGPARVGLAAPVEPRILAQDRPLELAQLGPGSMPSSSSSARRASGRPRARRPAGRTGRARA